MDVRERGVGRGVGEDEAGDGGGLDGAEAQGGAVPELEGDGSSSQIDLIVSGREDLRHRCGTRMGIVYADS